MKSNYFFIPVVVLSIFSLLMFDTQYAIGFSVTNFNNGTTDVRAIAVKDGETNFALTDTITDSVYVRNQNTKALVATITSITNPFFGFTVDTQPNRAYFIGGATGQTVYEIDLVNGVLLRSASHGCSATTQGVAIDSTNGFLYCALATEVINKFSISTFTVLFSSTTLNAGATPCDSIEALSYRSSGDTLFAGCSVGGNVVAVIGLETSGTPDFSVVYDTDVSAIAFNENEDNIAVCSSAGTAPTLYDFSTSTGFSVLAVMGAVTDVCNTNENGGRMVFDSQSDRFFQVASNNRIIIYDATDGSSLISANISPANGQITPISNFEAWGNMQGGGADNDYYVVDLTGIPLGSSGTGGTGGGTGGIDCTLPENAQILICRLGGEGCDNNVLGCVGNTVLGNATGGTGLTGVICGVGFVDCQANPDIKTNGIGYLLLAIALGIEIGILWVASRGDLRQIPTFIWFIATIAIIAGLTLFNWIDATMLVLGVIVAVALASAKARGFFGGDSF